MVIIIKINSYISRRNNFIKLIKIVFVGENLNNQNTFK